MTSNEQQEITIREPASSEIEGREVDDLLRRLDRSIGHSRAAIRQHEADSGMRESRRADVTLRTGYDLF